MKLLSRGKSLLPLLTLLLVHPAALANNEFRLITTTSVTGSGLADLIVPAFESNTGIKTTLVAAGTGKVLRLAREGNADLIWVHAPRDEQQLVNEGYATRRVTILKNDFVIIGPSDDPARIRGSATVVDALKQIARGQYKFVSRGDDSGTHKKELDLWEQAGMQPFGLWYYESGMRMSRALEKAEELGAYLLIDRGTWLKNKNEIALKPGFEGDDSLINYYSLLPINPKRVSNVNTGAAQQFIDFMLSETAQTIIENYRISGERLFIPVRK